MKPRAAITAATYCLLCLAGTGAFILPPSLAQPTADVPRPVPAQPESTNVGPQQANVESTSEPVEQAAPDHKAVLIGPQD